MFIGIPFTSAVAVPVIVHVSRNRASASCERNAQYSASAASAESRFMSAPPIRYQPQEILSSSPSGGDIRHCPAVPARRSRLRSTPLSVRIHRTPPTRNERNRYPLKSPNTRCPASCTRTCAYMDTSRLKNISRNMEMSSPHVRARAYVIPTAAPMSPQIRMPSHGMLFCFFIVIPPQAL